jgi:PAS domain S-box-containing protein
MQLVGSNRKTYFSNIVRLLGLVVPVLITFYGLLVMAGVLNGFRFTNNTGFFIIVFWWIALGIIQFLLPSNSKLDTAFRLAAYHLLTASFLLFVSGIISPFLILWVLLFLSAQIYFGRIGLYSSIIIFTIMVAADILLWQGANSSIFMQDIVYFTIVLFVGLMIVAIFNTKKPIVSIQTYQESLQQNRILTLINSLTDAVLNVDKNGKVRIYNAASLNLLDTNEDLKGKYIDKILTLNDRDSKTVRLFEQYKHIKQMMIRDDLWHTFKDGGIIRLEITYSPIHGSYSRTRQDDSHEGYIVIMRDVTKAKSLEEERDEFISVVSHELRTPITIAEGTISNAQFVLDRPNASLNMIKEAINGAHEQIVFLAHMVNDLSTLSRAERGVADESEQVDLRELADKLFAEYAKEAEAKSLQFNLDTSTKLGSVNVSRLYLEEMLHNFITNAIKYTKKGSVTLAIKRENNNAVFTVQDTGIGISRAEQAKVFEKFWRSEDYRTRETSGTGLGLYVASKLAKKLKTSIKLTSRLNHGSIFSFLLPISENDEEIA